jgi:hypothetical protein
VPVIIQKSKPSARIAAPDAPDVLIDLVEVEFLRAEAGTWL